MINIHMIVARVSNMSMLANILFFNPNWSGVKAKLNTRFNMNGRHINIEIFPFIVLTIIYPNDMAISIYKIVHAGPNNHEGGDHFGFLSC